jgi:hypothetical protein
VLVGSISTMESRANAGAAIVATGTAAAAACLRLKAAPAAALDVETTAEEAERGNLKNLRETLMYAIPISYYVNTFGSTYLVSPLGTLLGAKAIAVATIARKAMIWNDFMVDGYQCIYNKILC